MLPYLSHDLTHHEGRHISTDQLEHEHPVLHEVVGHKVAHLHPDPRSIPHLLPGHGVLVNRTQVPLHKFTLQKSKEIILKNSLNSLKTLKKFHHIFRVGATLISESESQQLF